MFLKSAFICLIFLSGPFLEASDSPELTATQTVLSVYPSEKSTFGEQVILTVKVVPTYVPGFLPTGSVAFIIDKETVANKPLVNGTASYKASSLKASIDFPHHFQAVYSGDSTYARSQDYMDYSVLPVNTAVKVSSNINPSTWGQTIVLTAKAFSLRHRKAVPQGVIEFQLEGEPIQTIALDAKGQASFSISDIEVGKQLIRAKFLGNENFNPSSASDYQEVNKTATKTTIASSQNPSPLAKR